MHSGPVRTLEGEASRCLSFIGCVIRLQVRDCASSLKFWLFPWWISSFLHHQHRHLVADVPPLPAWCNNKQHKCQTVMNILPPICHWNASATADHWVKKGSRGFLPHGTATSNRNTLCVMLQKCTWKGFCVSKNAHVLSDQSRLLMFPCVQLN